VAEVAALAEFAGYDVVLNVQGDEPRLDPRAMAAALDPVRPGIVRHGDARAREEDGALLDSPHVVKGRLRWARRRALLHARPDPGGERGVRLRARVPCATSGCTCSDAKTLLAVTALPPAPPERAEGLEQLRALWHGFKIRVGDHSMAQPGVESASDRPR